MPSTVESRRLRRQHPNRSESLSGTRHGIGVSAVGVVGVVVHWLRRRYGELLRQEVARMVSKPQELDEELRHLIAVLGR